MVNNSNLLDFQDPGMMPKELMDMPGFVNELKNHTLAVAPRPNEPLAFAGALAMLAHLTGRSYMDERGTHTNLYIAALAPTGMGKDEPRVTNKRLAAEAGILGSVPDAIASGEALEDAVADSPSLLLQTDEADALLTAMRGGDSRASKLNEMVLRFFSEAKSGHAMRLKAGMTKAPVIPLPHLTLFATGIPKFVYGALSAKALENGLLGRCLFIETDEFRPLGEMRSESLPGFCVEVAKAMAARGHRFTETGVMDPVVVREDDSAKRKIADLRQTSDEVARRLFDSDLKTAAALYCRLYEKAMKLAMLAAISENSDDPVITGGTVEYAAQLAVFITKKMLYEAQFNIAEGAFDRLKKRFLALLARHGGECDRTTMLRHLAIDSAMLSKIVKTLHMCDLIEEEQLDRRKVIYSIKAA